MTASPSQFGERTNDSVAPLLRSDPERLEAEHFPHLRNHHTTIAAHKILFLRWNIFSSPVSILKELKKEVPNDEKGPTPETDSSSPGEKADFFNGLELYMNEYKRKFLSTAGIETILRRRHKSILSRKKSPRRNGEDLFPFPVSYSSPFERAAITFFLFSSLRRSR